MLRISSLSREIAISAYKKSVFLNCVKANNRYLSIKEKMMSTLLTLPSTDRVYYQDTYLAQCQAKIVNSNQDEQGSYVVFDKTIFHPQGGGQPDDKGHFEINGEKFIVTKLSAPRNPKEEPYIIKHYYEASAARSLPEINAMALLVLDMQSRSLYARLHSAGHLIANTVNALYPQLVGHNGNHFPGTSFVMFKGSPIPEKDTLKAQVAETLAKFIKDGLPVKNSWQTETRTIQFGDLTAFPCGGTHVTNSQDIGNVTIRKVEVKKGELKIGYDVA